MRNIKFILLLLLLATPLISQEYLENTAIIRIKNFQIDDALVNDILSKSNAKIQRRILPIEASLRYGSATNYKAANNTRYNAILKAEEPLLRTFVIQFESNETPDKFCYYLAKDNAEIEIAEPYYLQKVQAFIPNDPLISNQEDALNLVRAFEAWEIEQGSPDIVIGISDNGIQQTHPDLKDNIATNNADPINGKDDDGNGYIDDYKGFNLDGWKDGELWWNTNTSDNHGTIVAGIAGADFNNGIGVAGVGGKSKIFPIRIGSIGLGNRYTAYGYESMIYAGVRKFKVLNCSWGKEDIFSTIQESIVQYAVANDVAIVASSGNLSGGQTKTTKFYPAGFKGILGVGVSSRFDGEIGSSSLGAHCRIMAPASGNMSTNIDTGQNSPYFLPGNATSFSSPVVAGAVAIARAKFPQLDAIQAIEYVRQSVDDISGDLFFYQNITPGRLNMYKIVTNDPMSIPGLTIKDVRYFDNTGAENERFNLGDTVYVELDLKNVLGIADDLNINLSIGYPEFPALKILDSTRSAISFLRNEEKTIGKFKFVVSSNYDDKIVFRLDIRDDEGYSDFLLFDKIVVPQITTFENESIKFSMSDAGTFGFESGAANKSREGYGFIDKGYGSNLFLSGIFVTENDVQAVTSFPFNGDNSKFFPLKKFQNPNNTNSMITASPFETTRAQVDQTVELPKKAPWVRIKIDLTDSLNLGSQYSVGYEFDWDIGLERQYNSNYTKFLESARSSSIPYEKFAAIYTGFEGYNGTDQVFGTAMYSDETDALGQAVGLKSGGQPFNSQFLIDAMKSGKTLITNEVDDIFNFVGVRFNNEFDSFETKTCYLCVSGASDTTSLANNLRECASGVTSVENNNLNSVDFNSVNNSFEINNIKYIQTNVFNLNGSVIYNTDKNNFNLSNLNQGIYLVQIEFEDTYVIKKISIIR